MPELDPDRRNQLGKGILSPDVEADLLKRGMISAIWVDSPRGGFAVCSKRNLWQAMADMMNDAIRSSYTKR